MEYINIANCTKTIKNTIILNDINLELQKNKIYGFVGRNGSGKTMLFKILSGLAFPTSGQVFIQEKPIIFGQQYPVKLGLMIENNGLWPHLNAYKNLSILADIRKELTEKEVRDSITRVGLKDDKKVFSKYSLGMKQRLVFAQAIMEQPELLILDEPTSALDEDGVRLFKSIIMEEKRRGATILMSSHSMDDITEISDEIIRMENGGIVTNTGGIRE